MNKIKLICHVHAGVTLRRSGASVTLKGNSEITEIDRDFWTAWCSEHAGSPLLDQIVEVR